MKRAFITGVGGQDGSYLAELLLNKGYEVHGLIRSLNTQKTIWLQDIINNNNFQLHCGNLNRTTDITDLIHDINPQEIYNLAAESDAQVSFIEPEEISNTLAFGPIRILESIKILNKMKDIKFYQAGSAEMFGHAQEIPQSETTPFHPLSPYGCAKVYAYWMTRTYREKYGIYAVNGILFNHESPRRRLEFVTKKITNTLYNISINKESELVLGNLNAKRDWGHAIDFVEAMWLMLQQNSADDYVIATGAQHTVREFAEKCCKIYGIDLEWQGEEINEVGLNKETGNVIIKISSELFRPLEMRFLSANCSRAEHVLGWKPRISFDELIIDMCNFEKKKSTHGNNS